MASLLTLIILSKSMVRHYEILTILPGTLSEVDVEPVVAKIQEMIESEGATSLTTEAGGKSRLAYPIKHIRYGYFHVFTFQAESETISKIEEKLRLFGQILRTIIRLYDPTKREEGKQSMMSYLGTEDEKMEKEEQREEKPVKKEEPAEVTPAPVEEKKSAKTSEEEPKDVDLKDFDKQLEAILDDKIAGL